MKTLYSLLITKFALFCLPVFSFSQAAGQMSSATPAEPAGETMKDAPSGILDLSDLGAKIAFLVFLAIFFTLYMFLRRQPTSKELKKQKKRKR